MPGRKEQRRRRRAVVIAAAMTDEELIAQLEQASPEDLSPAMVELIRSRLEKSPAVRTALVERLYTEQYLAGALGGDLVSREQVVARAARLRPARTISKRAIGVWIASLGMASVALAFAVRPFMSRNPPVLTAQANRQSGEDAHLAGKETDSLPTVPPSRSADDPSPDDPSPDEPSRDDPVKPETVSVDPPRKVVSGEPKEAEANVGGPPRPLSELMFEDIGLGGHTLREGDLPRWFTAVPGQAHRFTERIVRNRRCGFFDGWIKLRGAWPADGMLRLALSDHNRLRLHFYHGDRGVTLTYYEDHRHAWAAYSVSRATGDMRPQSPILVATDEERSFRTSPNGLGPIDIAWREGQLLLSRGDVRLLAAPLAGSPDDVYLEGHAGFRGLTMVRVEGVPPLDKPAVAPEHPVTGEFTAAKEIWKTETPTGATWTQHDDGSVELAVAKTKSPAWATWKLPRRDLCEIVMELEEATPGSGVFVADESGQPADVVRFFRDPTSGQTTIGIAPASDARSDQASDPKAGPIPSVSPRPLLRLIVGCGILRCWIGPDGRHWAPAVTTTQSVPAPFATVGLYCKSSESRRSIRLRRIEIRELAGLTGVVGDAVRARAVAIPQANDLADWLKQVDSRLPHDVERDEWRRGCALATLGHGANPRLGTPLLATLLDELLANPRPIESRLAALADAALVVNTWDHHADALSYLARYRALGQRAFDGGESRPYSLIRLAQMQCPLAARQGAPATAASLARLEILQAISDSRWEELDRLCGTVKFWKQPSGDDRRDGLAEWAQSVAAARLPKRAGQPTTGIAPALRHPLDEQISPEMFNLMAELNAALETRAYRDAAGTIASATGKLLEGDAADLLSDPRDDHLFVPLAGAVKLAMRDHPPLAAAMNEHFGPIARQRVQRAMSEGNRAVLEAATTQFQGTEAASMAHAWLGGEALALGEFAKALSHFERGLDEAAPIDRVEIAARARLAAAALGRDFGSPVTASVTMGETQLAAGEFEALVTQMRGSAPGTSDAKAVVVDTIPNPTTFRMEKRGEFDGGVVQKPAGNIENDGMPMVDWFLRQTTLLMRGDRVLVTTPNTISAFDRGSGSQKWNSGPVGTASRAAGFSPAAPSAARPLVLADRIVVRRLTSPSPSLVAFDLENGKSLWESRLASREAVVSDPVAIGGDVLAFVAPREERQTTTTLALAAFDPASGEVRWRRPIVRLRDSWWSQPVCQVTIDGDTLFATLGGATVACDMRGRVKWLRRAERVPAAVDGWSLLQAQDRPILARVARPERSDGRDSADTPIEDSGRAARLVIAQIGVRIVEGLDPTTGRKHWGRVFPDLLSLAGVSGQVVVVQIGQAVLGLDLGSGRTMWRYECGNSAAVLGCTEGEGVLLARREDDRTTLVWLATKTGQETGRTTPDGQEDRPMQFGPVVADSQGRGWALVTRDPNSTKRDFCEIVSAGSANPGLNLRQESVWVRRARQD